MAFAKEKIAAALKIIAGYAYSDAADAAIREIDINVPTVVLVPDRYTLQTEKRALKLLNLPGSFNISVHSFDRLFYSVCGAVKTMPAASAVMLLQKIISAEIKNLGCFKRSAEFPGFAEKIYGVISGLKSSGIKPGDLEKAGAAGGALSLKLADIRLLYEKYEEESSGYFDINDRMRRLAELIDAGKAGECRVVLCGFDALTALETDIIMRFLAAGCPVTAALPHRQGHPAYSGELYESLLGAAQRARARVETVFIKERDRPPVFRHLAANLGRFPFETAALDNNSLTVYEAADVFSETRKTAEMISVYSRRGYRYGEMAVICSDIEQYAPALESVLPLYGVTYFINEPQTLINHPFYSYITAAVDAGLRGYNLPDILVFVKNPFFNIYGVTEDEKNIFENYCLAYGVNRGGFFKEFSLGGDESGAAESVRRKLAAALLPFGGSHTGGEYAALIEELLLKTEGRAAELAAAAEYRAAELLRQGGAGFKAVAAEMARIFGAAPVKPLEFREVFKRGCEIFSVSAVPETQDCVQIGRPGLTRLTPPKVLFIMGASEGKLPPGAEDTGMISDGEIETLRGAGLALVPSALASNMRASAEVYQAVISPRGALHISYPVTDASGKPGSPAHLAGEISRLFLKNGFPLTPYNKDYDIFDLSGTADRKRAAALAADIYAPTDAAALRSLAVLGAALSGTGSDGGAETPALYRSLTERGLIRAGETRAPYIPATEAVSGADRLFFYREAVKVSQIERFYACPYAHFMEYGLRLKERPEAEPDGANIGTLLHAVLEAFMKEGMVRGGGEVFDTVVENTPGYEILRSDIRLKPVFRRLRAESENVCAALKKQQEYSAFTPAFFELDFMKDKGTGAKPLTLKTGGRELRLSGKIDRADISEVNGKKYARVIDYKSGSSETKFGYGGLAKGTGLQLMVYLAYMRAAGYAPAGAFYFRVHNNPGDGYRMNGVMSAGDGLPEMMDSRLCESGFKSDIIPAATNLKGGYKKSAYLVPPGDLDLLCEYALGMMGAAGERIGAGECAVFPLDGACKFCPYGGICLFDPDKGECRKMAKTYRKVQDLIAE